MKAWRIEVFYKAGISDPQGASALRALRQAGLEGVREVRTIRGTLLPGTLSQEDAVRAASELLCDPVIEDFRLLAPGAPLPPEEGLRLTVIRRPGVMDPVAHSTVLALRDMGIVLDRTATYRAYLIQSSLGAEEVSSRVEKILANEVIEQVLPGRAPEEIPGPAGKALPRAERVPLAGLDGPGLERLSRDRFLSLSLEEMRAIQEYFARQGREPTDVELETLAQTWSEHCKHKTLTGVVEYEGRVFDNLLASTIAAVTRELDKPWCLSVFEDNAGVVDFHGDQALCVKVETHNHPSAIEPFGGAGTGIGGVIRDILGTGLGARPVANLDVFCFAPPDMSPSRLPEGVLHPRRILEGVVAGVRDYGNPMGIPTVNGSLSFDEGYAGNPLVYCGCVGILPKKFVSKEVRPGDLVLLVGGRTGRDGIHGATFSSVELSHDSEEVSGGAVQIGDPITEKKLLEGLIRARDRGLYRSVTDCGAGGLSSAVGEMGERVGARVDLSKVPLKYEGLAPWEVWVSEAQERMVLAVPPEHLEEILEVFRAEEVEATPLGSFGGGRLVLTWEEEVVADLDLHFLHHGLPRFHVSARRPRFRGEPETLPPREELRLGSALARVLSDYNVASKEWVIRQYDHEVQAGSAGKPFCGREEKGPSDGAVCAPLPGVPKGFALGHGLTPRAGKIDPYAAAALAVDEAVRNVTALGADPERIALLDNFCWGNPRDPEQMGSLVEACLGCSDAARVFGAPFISGKDSLNNEFRGKDGKTHSIPGTLLITALGIVPDLSMVVGTDWKRPGNAIWILGSTGPEMGGSVYLKTLGFLGDRPPVPRAEETKKTARALHRALKEGWVRAVHDLSEGGLGAALAESCFGSGLGAEIELSRVPVTGGAVREDVLLFAETPGRFLLEVEPEAARKAAEIFQEIPHAEIGRVTGEARLEIRGLAGGPSLEEEVARLEEAWRRPLDFGGKEARSHG